MTAFLVEANAAFSTYTELVDAVNDWLDRNDLSGVAGQMIALAEARMRRHLDSLLDEKTTSLAVVDGVASLPADYSKLIRVVYDGDVLPNFSRTAAPDVPTSSKPYGYTVESGQIKIWPASDATIEILYHPTIPQLTATAPSNGLLDRHPDLYFYGAMLFAEGYLANDSRAAMFKQLFEEALADVKVYYLKQRHGGPIVPKLQFCP